MTTALSVLLIHNLAGEDDRGPVVIPVQQDFPLVRISQRFDHLIADGWTQRYWGDLEQSVDAHGIVRFTLGPLESIKNLLLQMDDEGIMGLTALADLDLPPMEMLFGGIPRSPLWDRVRAEHLVEFPTCAACGGTEKVQVHHVKPYHKHPELELDKKNLLTLCTGRASCNCHLTFGHLGHWEYENPNVREMAAEYLALRISEKTNG